MRLLVGGQIGMFFLVTQYLEDVRGYSAVDTGVGFLPLTLISFIGSQLAARRLTYLFGRKTLTLAGMMLTAIGLVWLTQLAGYWSVFGRLDVDSTTAVSPTRRCIGRGANIPWSAV